MLSSPGQCCLQTFSGFTRENLMQPFFDPDGIALPLFYFFFLLLPFPGVALMVPTWMFSQSDTSSWLRPPPVEGACAFVALDQISRGGESEI